MSRTVQWLNENSYRAYPFVEDSNLAAGSLAISNAVLLDFSGIVYNRVAQAVRLLRVEITSAVVPEGIFTFGYAAGSEFSLSVPASASLPYTAVVSVAGSHRMLGVFGEGITTLLTNPAGTYTLDAPPQIEPALLVFQDKHRVISVRGSSLGSVAASGVVYLGEGYNCDIAVDSEANAITISAIRGAGNGIYCGTLDSAVLKCNEALLSLNGFHADDNGNFILLAGEGVNIIPDVANHVVEVAGNKTLDELGCG